MKLRFKLMLIMIILSLVTAGSIGIALVVKSSPTIRDFAYESTFNLTEGSAKGIEAYLDSSWQATKTLVQIMEGFEDFIASNRRNAINTMLRGVATENPTFLAVWSVWEPNVLEGNDQLYADTPGSLPNGRFAPFWYRSGSGVVLDVLEMPDNGDYYLLAKNSGRAQLLEPYTRNYGGKPVLVSSIVFPIRSLTDNRILGVAGVDIDLDIIQELCQSIRPFPDALSALFSNSGLVVSHFIESRIGGDMRLSEQDMAGSYLDTFVNAIKAGEPLRFSNFIQALNKEMYVFTVPIKVGEGLAPWGLAVGIMTKTVMAPVYGMIFMAAFISIGIILVVIGVAFFLSKSIAKPIVNVADTLKYIGEGDFTKNIAADSRDEIGDLARYFNQTLEKIRKLIILIKNQTVKLSDTGDDLASSMTETAAAVNEITANIQSIKGRIINQSASVSQTNATMEQVMINITKLDTLVESQSSNVSSASSAVEEMAANIQSVAGTLAKNVANVDSLTEASEVGRAGLHEVASDIQEIARESEGLLEINSVMENIASQTNLLSMNAAIEAAHAGEAGKGFAVVADEIRKLAENSGEQSKIISEVLKKIRGSIEKISASTETVLARFEAIDSNVKIVSQQEEHIRCAMDEQGEGSRLIVTGVAEINEITRQVKSGSDEMLEGSKEVITESRNLEMVTQEIASGMNDMAMGVEEINVAVNHVNEISGKNRDGIGVLLEEVSRFKVE
jgi:methyl-accepting chemotaxis protein